MTKYDFETIIDRRGTGCLKWDAWSRRGHAPDDLPLWVADMDFKTAPAAIEALAERVQHGVFGYTMATDGYCEAVQSWFERRHGWRPKREWLVMTPGVVFALAVAVNAFTQPGDRVSCNNGRRGGKRRGRKAKKARTGQTRPRSRLSHA